MDGWMDGWMDDWKGERALLIIENTLYGGRKEGRKDGWKPKPG